MELGVSWIEQKTAGTKFLSRLDLFSAAIFSSISYKIHSEEK